MTKEGYQPIKTKKTTKITPPNTGSHVIIKTDNTETLKNALNRIADLEKENADLDTALEDCTESLTDARIKIKELEKENEELKDKLKNLESVAEVRLANWQKYEKENTELKLKLEALDGQTPWKDIKDKSELIGQHSKDIQNLTKAKEVIKELSKSLFLAKGIVRDLIDDTVDFKESKARAIYCYEQEKFDTYKKAEDFLKECE